ncbi:death-inducer obliterator 1-like isoform X2 [Carassius carassius]|uniref:death-inducer obliterator 1-like isoform X2 n=1 Tax=Carassius carassius TaxID=217509 RepID=UPI00286977B7|nr:death-inducer obliterator 1-like isoform X2 [Carassius carassius]
MEESVSPELAQASEPEPSQDPVDTSSQEPPSVSEEVKDKKDQGDVSEDKVEDPDKSAKPPCEFKKTWGLRRTTIAKREIPGEMAAETPEGRGAPVRRSGRQAKRTDKLEEFLVTVKRGRGTGRRSCPSRLEGGDPPSQTPTDAETASEASFDGNVDAKVEEQRVASPEKKKRGRGRMRRAVKPKPGNGSVSDDGSSENEEKASGEVMKETQENVETATAEDGKDGEEEQAKDVEMKEEEGEEECNKNKEKTSNESINRRPTRAVCKDSKRDSKPKVGVKLRNEKKEDDDEESSSSESDSDGYDPNALYCICRQKHNKRFMICCDRCEEWFHGDCVGIPEARGRLMERNGEDYVCPNCYTQKGQFSKAGSTTAAAENGKRPAAGLRKSESALATPSSTVAAAMEEKASDDLGIKGRIEKATNPSGKKKIKIFQPVTAVEGSCLPKCIGPGCERDALPDSVYCGNDCILRHAAAAMKTITTDGKDSKQKERGRPKAQKKTSNKSPNKRRSGPERRSSNQAGEEEESESGTEEYDDDEDEKHAEEHPPPPAMSSWSSDHNYIAVTPEKTTTISASVLNKTSAAQKDKEKEDDEEVKPEKKTASTDKKPPASNVAPKGGKKSPGSKGTKAVAATSPLPKGKTTAAPLNSGRELRKQSLPIQGKSKKPGPPPPPIPVLSPSGPPGSRHHVTGALRVGKSTFTIPKKQPQVGQKDSVEQGPSPTSRTPPSPGSSTQHSAPKPNQPIAPAAPQQPPPNNQMRSNIRRSLTDILYKRASDSDDLSMSESGVGKLAVSIEKEMFNLYMNTDNKYKNKYRSLMFNLKDPKNKGLFYRVVGGEISPFRLVRLSPEELLSREMSDWRKSEISESLDMSVRSQSGQPKSGSRQEGAPPVVDMEEAPPPMSDGDVCMPATSQSPHLASAADSQEDTRPTSVSQAPVSTGKGSSVPDIFSSMLKDTTAEHRAHLFDLNCKICTGQKLVDDEPPSKKNKMSAPKKPENSFTSKSESRPSKSPADLPQVSSLSGPETPISDSAAVMEDLSSVFPVVQAPVTAAVPAVSSVTITRRDPRTAGHRSSVPQIVPDVVVPAMPSNIPISVEPVVVEAKGPLPMPPPAPASIPRPVIPKTASYGSSSTSMSEPPPEGETALFLSGQEMMWKGFINMHSVAKFVTKAYLVSGSFEHIKEDLPDTIHIGGRISPHTVWDYVGKLKTSLSKELSLIRFHPATEEEEVAYVSLFSYFSSRKRFGVVANSNKRIKDLYLIPLSSKDPLPAKLLPFDGPGLEPARPNLLLGLLICQKDRKRRGAPLENEEKHSKTLRDDETGLPKPSTTGKSEIKQDKVLRTSLDAISTTPPGTPPPLSAPESSSSVSSVFSLLSSLKAPGVSNSTGNNSPSSNVSAASSTPLQTILKSLFGKKKQDSDVSSSPSDQSAVDVAVPCVSLLDPIVQHFAITKGKEVEVQDDRPYDPEEEYDPAVGYSTGNTHDTTKVSAELKQADVTPLMDDVAYDPEDDSLFDDVGVDPSTKKLTEHQKVFEEKHIEERKHEEPVHQQIPETLISQPVTSLLAESQLLQLGKKVEELVAKNSATPVINQRRDPRQSRDPRQVVTSRRKTSDSTVKEEESSFTTDKTSPQQGTVIETPQTQACSVADTQTAQLDSTKDTLVEEPSATTDIPLSQVISSLDSVQSAILDSEVSKSEEGDESEEDGKSEEMPFLDTKSTEVSIPLLGEKIDPELVESYMEKEPEEEPKIKDDPIESEIKSFEEVWPNSASILKADQVSSIGQPIETTTTTYYNISTISTSSTSLHSGVPQDVIQDNSSYMDSHSPHIQHIPTTNPTNIPPPMSFPPPIGPPPIFGPPPMQGPPPIAVPPPMHLPLSMSGPPLMQIPSIQGPPPPLVDNDHSQYPPHGSYPPFQSQWGSSSQLDAAPRGPLPPNFTPRGPFQPMDQRGPPHQIFDNSISSLPPQHIRPRGPPPGPPPPRPPPTFDGQRFNGPPPPFNFSAPRVPPPPFSGPPPNLFDNRPQPLSHFPGPRGPSPLHNIGDRGPPSNVSRGPGDQFEDCGNSYHQGIEKPQIPSQGPPFRGLPPNHFDGRRGPPGPSGEMSGQGFPPPNQFRGSPQHRGSFDEPLGTLSQDFDKHRRPSVQQFGGLRDPPPGHYEKEPVSQPARFNYNDDTPSDVRDVRPVRGPLLPTPPEGPIPIQSRIVEHSPDSHRDDHWRRQSPEMRRRSCSTRDTSEPHNRPSRFDGASRDRDASSRLSEDIQHDLSEDRRDQDREGGHGARSWGWNREHEYDRGREKDRERDRSRERERELGRSREREREHSRERDRNRGRDSERYGDGDKRRDRDRDRDRGSEREQDRKDHDRDRGKNRDRERDRNRDRDSRDRRRERSRSRERERGKDRERRDRDRERDKDRGKDRDRRDSSRSKEKKDAKKERSDKSRAKSTESENPS